MTYRRPLAQRAEDIGAWAGILQMMTFLAVVTNVSKPTLLTSNMHNLEKPKQKLFYFPIQFLLGMDNCSIK